MCWETQGSNRLLLSTSCCPFLNSCLFWKLLNYESICPCSHLLSVSKDQSHTDIFSEDEQYKDAQGIIAIHVIKQE